MKRRIIEINKDKCNGCGLCAEACHEGAIGMVDGKAVLLRDDYCDGLGDCLPTCPTGAISFIEKDTLPSGESRESRECLPSQLCNWPVQIKLAPISAPYFDGANLLVAADCTAYAYANFHHDFIRGRLALIGCPKLDMVDYAEKLEAIIVQNDIKSLTVLRMEVPCCGGIEFAAKTALQKSGKFIPWNVVTISTVGEIL